MSRRASFSILAGFIFISLTIGILLPLSALARELEYSGPEVIIYVEPGTPTQINFPGTVRGGFKKKTSSISLEKHDESIIVFADTELAETGEAILVHLNNKQAYAIRVKPPTSTNPRDEIATVKDLRTNEIGLVDQERPTELQRQFAPPSSVSGLMREMMLITEFGKKKNIPGYHRSDRHRGEVVLSDGMLEANIDEIFMGKNLWGYVLNVTNLLETTQRINPATFRLDGTRAITASRWELAPRAVTIEEQNANKHVTKVFVITRVSDTARTQLAGIEKPIYYKWQYPVGALILFGGIAACIAMARRNKRSN